MRRSHLAGSRVENLVRINLEYSGRGSAASPLIGLCTRVIEDPRRLLRRIRDAKLCEPAVEGSLLASLPNLRATTRARACPGTMGSSWAIGAGEAIGAVGKRTGEAGFTGLDGASHDSH
jgi:hypothetical protein